MAISWSWWTSIWSSALTEKITSNILHMAGLRGEIRPLKYQILEDTHSSSTGPDVSGLDLNLCHYVLFQLTPFHDSYPVLVKTLPTTSPLYEEQLLDVENGQSKLSGVEPLSWGASDTQYQPFYSLRISKILPH
ncbi:hypothetical protein RRG08_039077 [Elysia crispata]|uniref:Uncharacterized protein n=1 Tax=Elysia crispata TaxID=231223 RepID=A0AAE0YIG8_9GAST|nr:hypothetical protein RRG08_039077 [Elysia crispata]